MKCPACGAAETVRDTRDMKYAYGGVEIVIPQVSGDYCPVCGEVVIDRVDDERVSAAMLRVVKSVRANTD